MPKMNVGILGIGTHLPPAVRLNSDWSPTFLERFEKRADGDLTTPDLGSADATELVKEVLSKFSHDPFRGSRERRVLDPQRSPSHMEIEAGKQALELAGVRPEQIGFLALSSMVPDLIQPQNHSLVHTALGLPRKTLACSVDSSCAGSIPALLVGAAQIAAGQCDFALLIQSAAFSRVMDYERPLSVNFGDGASAIVLGRVPSGRGIEGYAFLNDGSYHRAATIAAVNGEAWYDGKAKQEVTSLDPVQGRPMVLKLGFLAKEAVEAALSDAGRKKSEVDFFAAHQPTAWFNELCQRAAGLEHTRSAVTFAKTAAMGPANVPFNLDAGVRSGALKDGDLAMLYSCGGGLNWGAIALRWGR